jgi:hypothetical protein
MKEFIHRTISKEAEYVDANDQTWFMKAWRTRTSSGQNEIGIEFFGGKILFNEPEVYEANARQMIDLLQAVCDEPCLLPVSDQTAQRGE